MMDSRLRPFGVFTAIVTMLAVPGCGGGGTGATGAAGTSGQAGVGGGAGTTGTGGLAGMGAGGSGTDGGLGPLSFDLDGVAMSATTAAAQVGTTAGQSFLRVLGTTSAFSLNVYLIGAASTTPGTYACDPSTTSGSLVSYQETASGTSYTSFDTSCTVTITQVGAVGAPVTGSFSGMVRNGAAAPRSITNGRFDVVRAQ
jgi:hypothetical protein